MHIILYHMHIIFLYPQYTSQCTPLSAPLSVHPSPQPQHAPYAPGEQRTPHAQGTHRTCTGHGVCTGYTPASYCLLMDTYHNIDITT